MGHRYIKNGKEEEGTGGRNKKKISHVNVISHLFCWFTSRLYDNSSIPLSAIQDIEARLVLFIDLIWCGRSHTDVIDWTHWYWFVSGENMHATDPNRTAITIKGIIFTSTSRLQHDMTLRLWCDRFFLTNHIRDLLVAEGSETGDWVAT